jgi:hypothetical protein
MKTASPDSALAHERCQYRALTGRQCASRIFDPKFSYCPRRATGLAYIASLPLRTLPAIADGIGPREGDRDLRTFA